MTQEIDTLILRFRDLVTPMGQTIIAHNEICNSKKYVWWGWWNKSGEKIPDKEFREILRKANSTDGLIIILMDSGRSIIHKAKCIDVKWAIDHNKICSPDEDLTPTYYRTNKYYAWFKFEYIEENSCIESILNNYTYVRVDDFFLNSVSNYTCFYGKRIHSIEELRQQDRTIWFVRDAISSDDNYYISLLDGWKTKPANFSNQFIDSSSTNLLWVSDLHFSNDHHGFPLESTPYENKIWLRIENALNNNKIKDLAGVIVSGDITWRGEKEEYKLAQDFISQICSWGGNTIDNYKIAICPGNHDIQFSDKVKDVSESYEESKKEYEDFFSNLFYIKPNKYMSCGRRLLLGGAIPIEIVCLNSSMLQQDESKFKGHGFIGDDQLEDAAKQFNWTESEDKLTPFRIVVLHHHLLPVTYREIPSLETQYSVVLDAEALSRWIIKYNISMVLHGHMHQPFYAKVTRPLSLNNKKTGSFHVLGMGSSGVKNQDLGEIGKNTFGILQFNKKSVNLKIFTIHPTNPTELYYTIDICYED